MIINCDILNNPYGIVVEKGSLNKIKDYFDVDRKVLIVSDSLIPKKYIKTLINQIEKSYIHIFESGEEYKNKDELFKIINTLIDNNFNRKDAIIALGGGVTGDLAGFAASIYMRGIDFYNIPTSTLAMVDSSIGGKTAIDFDGYKNIVGSFYQPKKVLIDIDLLDTLDSRLFNEGLVESVKMALTFNKDLFELFENEDIKENIEKIIIESLLIKKDVVEKDEKEKNLRKVLNFGHTLGHAIEVSSDLYHGESVALGMLPMTNEEIKERLIKVLNKLNIPLDVKFDKKIAMEALVHDKKANQNNIDTILVDKIGTYKIEKMDIDELKERLEVLV